MCFLPPSGEEERGNVGAEQVGAQHPLPSWLRFHPSPYGSVPEGHFPWNYENLMGTYLYLKEWGPPCREAWGRGAAVRTAGVALQALWQSQKAVLGLSGGLDLRLPPPCLHLQPGSCCSHFKVSCCL